jgi:hypothetical protein
LAIGPFQPARKIKPEFEAVKLHPNRKVKEQPRDALRSNRTGIALHIPRQACHMKFLGRVGVSDIVQ